MKHMHCTTRRGLSLLELMIAMSVTVLIGAATVGMLNAVSVGVDSRHDNRTVTLRSHHAQSRLASYIVPSRCILYRDDNMIVLWLDDSRTSETVHLSEVRWIVHDPSLGEVTVHYADFSASPMDRLNNILNREMSAATNWVSALSSFQSNSSVDMRSTKLIDGLADFTIRLDTGADVLAARHVTFHLTFRARTGSYETVASATIREHRQPAF